MTTQTAPVTRYRFTADQYEAVIRTGILTKEDRVELIDGEVIAMPPMGPRHPSGVAQMGDVLYDRFRDIAILWSQLPVRLNERSDPEPDLALLRRVPHFYRGGLPTATDILLIAKVADTSLTYDRRTKAVVYSRAGIPEYWLHDIN